jgi:hypothetical protein
MRLTDFSALTFDCYGTLIDWETGILAALRPWTAAHRVEVGDEELLAAFARPPTQRHRTRGSWPASSRTSPQSSAPPPAPRRRPRSPAR